MAESKSALTTTLQAALPTALAGGGLGYLIESGKLSIGPIAGALALGFGLIAALLVGLRQLVGRVSTSAIQSENIQSDLAKQVSEAIASSQAGLLKRLEENEKALKSVTEAMTGMAMKVTQAYDGGADKLGTVLQTNQGEMKALGTAWADQIHGVFEQHQKMVQSAVNAMNATGEEWRTKLIQDIGDQIQRIETTMANAATRSQGLQEQFISGIQDHVGSISSSSRLLTDAINRLGGLGQDIEKLLHVQQAVDSTLDTISKTEEFKKTISRLSDHLSESDRLLREVSKPKTIRLVEEALES